MWEDPWRDLERQRQQRLGQAQASAEHKPAAADATGKPSLASSMAAALQVLIPWCFHVDCLHVADNMLVAPDCKSAPWHKSLVDLARWRGFATWRVGNAIELALI